MTDAAAYPSCVHGRKIYERCEPCEEGAKRGEHGGFRRAPESSNGETLVDRARNEADLCRSETANDVAALLDALADEIERLRAALLRVDCTCDCSGPEDGHDSACNVSIADRALKGFSVETSGNLQEALACARDFFEADDNEDWKAAAKRLTELQRRLTEKTPADLAEQNGRCLVEPVGGGVGDLPRCEQYPDCPCGGPQPEKASVFPHLDTCGLKYGGLRCTCGHEETK